VGGGFTLVDILGGVMREKKGRVLGGRGGG